MDESVVNITETQHTPVAFGNTSPHCHIPNHRHLSLAYTSLADVLTGSLSPSKQIRGGVRRRLRYDDGKRIPVECVN
jgi:hypothetical protein